MTIDIGQAGMGMAGVRQARLLELGVGVPQAADRVPDRGTHVGQWQGGHMWALCNWVSEWGQNQEWSWVVVVHQSPHHRDSDDFAIIVSHSVGCPHHLTLVSGQGLPIGVTQGCWCWTRWVHVIWCTTGMETTTLLLFCTAGAIYVCVHIVWCWLWGSRCRWGHLPVGIHATMTTLSLLLHPLWVMAGAWGGVLLVFWNDGRRWGLGLTICLCLLDLVPPPLFHLLSSLFPSFQPLAYLARHSHMICHLIIWSVLAFAQGNGKCGVRW